MKKKKKEQLSPCCNAKTDCCGGGYVGEDIAPIEDYCTKCGQILRINGLKQIICNPKTGKELTPKP